MLNYYANCMQIKKGLHHAMRGKPFSTRGRGRTGTPERTGF